MAYGSQPLVTKSNHWLYGLSVGSKSMALFSQLCDLGKVLTYLCAAPVPVSTVPPTLRPGRLTFKEDACADLQLGWPMGSVSKRAEDGNGGRADLYKEVA